MEEKQFISPLWTNGVFRTIEVGIAWRAGYQKAATGAERLVEVSCRVRVDVDKRTERRGHARHGFRCVLRCFVNLSTADSRQLHNDLWASVAL